MPARRRELFTKVQEAVRKSLEDVRRIAEELRPELLEHLGLVSALKSLAGTITGRAGLDLGWEFAPDLPTLPADTDSPYRIARKAVERRASCSGPARVGLASAW